MEISSLSSSNLLSSKKFEPKLIFLIEGFSLMNFTKNERSSNLQSFRFRVFTYVLSCGYLFYIWLFRIPPTWLTFAEDKYEARLELEWEQSSHSEACSSLYVFRFSSFNPFLMVWDLLNISLWAYIIFN